MQVVKDGKPIKSKSLSNRGAQARHFLGEIPRGIIYVICFPKEKRNWLNLNSIYQTNLKCLMIFWRFPSKETSSMVVVVDQNYPAKELCICFTAYPTIFYLVVSPKSSQGPAEGPAE